MFEETKSTGKVRISVDFIPPKSSGKWTVVQFMDGENNIFIRTTGSDKILGYTINGEKSGNDLVVHAIDTTAMVANKTYTVVLTIDYDKNEASVSLNGSTSVVLTGYNCTNAIGGLGFMTASSAADRSYTADNIVVEWSN